MVAYRIPTVVNFLFLTICFPVSYQASGQSTKEIIRFVGDDVISFVTPENFQKLEFDWDFDGSLQAQMNAGLTGIDETDYAQAAEHFIEVQKALPRFFASSYYLGVARKAQGKFAEAEQAFRYTISLAPRCWQAHLQLGETLHLRGHLAEAEKEYVRASQINSKLPEPLLLLGHLEFAKGNSRKALSLYEKTTQMSPSFAPGHVMQGVLKWHDVAQRKKVLDHLNRAIAVDSICKEALFWRGLYFIESNERIYALNDWNRLVESNPHMIRFIVLRGYLNIDLGRYDEAFSDLRRAVLAQDAEEDEFTGTRSLLDKRIGIKAATQYIIRNSYGLKDQSQKFFRRGYCLFLIGKYDDAIIAFEDALKTEPTAPVIFFSKGIAFEYSGKHADALSCYNRALELDPEIFEARKKRAMYRAEQRQWKGANEDLLVMERLQPDSKAVHKLKGNLKMGLKNYYGAIVDFSRFIKIDSTDTDAYFSRGFCHDQVGNPRLAADDYLNALRCDSSRSALYPLTAEQLLKVSDTIKSLKVRKAQVRRYPKEPSAWVELAFVFMLLKETQDGHRCLDTALPMITPGYFDKSELYVRAIHVKGMLYFQEKNYKAALKQFSKVLDFSSKDPLSQYMRGKCALELEDLKLAVKDFRALAEMDYRDSKKILSALTAE